MSQKLTDQATFDLIRYANCWEDAEILLKGLAPKPGSKILSIGSAGDNSFSLLTTDPASVVAVDINPIQLYLIALKKAAIQHLPYDELLAFLGFRPSNNRSQTLLQLRDAIDPEAYAYWQAHSSQIEQGIIGAGKFERYFQLFSHKVLPWIHHPNTTAELLRPKSEAEQRSFYHERWNTWRWRLLFKIFFSKYVMGKYGRDPAFLKEVKVPVGEFIFRRAEQHLQREAAQHNFILRYNLTGSFGALLPHYLQPEHIGVIRSRLHRLHLHLGFAEEAIAAHGSFDYMNLSNIFEYMNPELFEHTARGLLAATQAGGRLAYWNLMAPRRISAILPEQARQMEALSAELHDIDKGFFYSQFIVDEVI